MSDGCDNCLRGEDEVQELHCVCNECLADSESLDRQFQIAQLKKIRRLLPKNSADCQRARRYIERKLEELKNEELLSARGVQEGGD